jgi:DNA-binding transcriptional LysR family regulator
MTDLNALKDFLVLCQVKSFNRAADRCHVSVSGLSRRIQGLESWLGSPVFERSNMMLELADAGRQLQSFATEVVFALEGLKKVVRTGADIREKQIRFAAPHIMSAIFFPDWIPRLHTQFEGAKFSVMSDNLPACFGALHEGDADFVVVLCDQEEAVLERACLRLHKDQYLTAVLGVESLIPVSGPDAAGRPLFGLVGAAKEISFLGYSDECYLGWAVEHAFTRLPALPLVRHHQSSLADGLRAMTLSRMGMAWLPESMVINELLTRRLVRAGDVQFDIALQVLIMRKQESLGERSEAFWSAIQPVY